MFWEGLKRLFIFVTATTIKHEITALHSSQRLIRNSDVHHLRANSISQCLTETFVMKVPHSFGICPDDRAEAAVSDAPPW